MTLNQDELQVLRLHNKFSIMGNLQPGDLDSEQEASLAKVRMEKVKEQEYEEYTPEEGIESEEIEAENRMV